MEDLDLKKKINTLVSIPIIILIECIIIIWIMKSRFVQFCLSNAAISYLTTNFSSDKLLNFCVAWIILIFIISNGVYLFLYKIPNNFSPIFKLIHNNKTIKKILSFVKGTLIIVVNLLANMDIFLVFVNSSLIYGLSNILLLKRDIFSFLIITLFYLCTCWPFCFRAIKHFIDNYFFIF